MPSFPPVIAISASHRDHSNSEALLQECLQSLEKQNIPFQLVQLRKLRFSPCDGCAGCDTNEKCHLEDELQAIYPQLLAAKVWIIATPEYWWNVSGLCKNFLDRLNAYWLQREKYLWNKKIVILTVGGQPLERMGFAEQYLELFANKLHMSVIGKLKASAENPDEILQQNETLAHAAELGNQIAHQLRKESE